VSVGSPAPFVVVTPLTRELATLVGSWFADDEEGQRRLDANFYGAGLKWWQLVEQSPDRHGWVGLLGDERVGLIDVEVDGERGGIAICVRREFGGRGVGQRLLRLAAAEGSRGGRVGARFQTSLAGRITPRDGRCRRDRISAARRYGVLC
jgi:GNAT superfamily N-acetyltransferase